MKSIDSYKKEATMEENLIMVYKEYWKRMISAINTLTPEEVNKLSNPFLVNILPSYRKSKRRVLFVGQETNGWDSFGITLLSHAFLHAFLHAFPHAFLAFFPAFFQA